MLVMFEWFTLVVAVLAAAYAGLARFIQNKLINRSDMAEIQNESKRLSDEYEKAKKNNDKKKMDSIMQEQLEVLPKMNKVMFAQFKPMIIILAIFFALTFMIGQIDPFVKNSIIIPLRDDGKGCDLIAGDHVYSGCFTFNSTNYGKWNILFKTKKSGADLDSNSTFILYNTTSPTDRFIETAKGQSLIVWTDNKSEYLPGDTVKLYTKTDRTDVDEVDAVLDNGTSFYVDLPFAIPILNVQRIHQPYWWFILISLSLNLILSALMSIFLKPKTVEVKK